MSRHSNLGTRNIAHEEEHSELLARNIFRITMIGAFAFAAASLYVMMTP